MVQYKTRNSILLISSQDYLYDISNQNLVSHQMISAIFAQTQIKEEKNVISTGLCLFDTFQSDHQENEIRRQYFQAWSGKGSLLSQQQRKFYSVQHTNVGVHVAPDPGSYQTSCNPLSSSLQAEVLLRYWPQTCLKPMSYGSNNAFTSLSLYFYLVLTGTEHW